MTGFFQQPFLCIAHRGASAEAPENTLKAFARAREIGADAIELDVFHVDGELVVIHDDDLSRTTDGRGLVGATALTEIRRLDAGEGERVPLLGEVLDLVGDTLGINIELKGPGTAGPVIDLLRARGQGPERILLSAFDHEALHAARAAAPEYPRGALFSKPPADLLRAVRAVDAASVHMSLRHVRREHVAEVRAEADLPTLVYTVNAPKKALQLRDWGCAGVFTDDPAALLRALGRAP